MTGPKELIPLLDELGFVVEEELATVLFLLLQLEKPLLLEGPPGVGKTQVAYILSKYLGYDLIRLQCYEGLDVNNAIYEWNYQKQLLAIKIYEQSGISEKEKEELIFSEEYLLKRPLLQAISADRRMVLLIDEIDRADEEFEAFLLELLSDFQISIPELGTIKAKHKPVVVLTSNRTRELSDALKRRCLYHWVNYPDMEKEIKIIRKHIPDIEMQLAAQIGAYVSQIRRLKLDKSPGISETIDWARGIAALHGEGNAVYNSLSCLLKSDHDIKLVAQEIFQD
ncbi:AAA family ATPase [Lewinella sp. LCG006]|uniref:AAA family ATPase n=1 Tax=Lewinella sp. LCG006 TaxID=3231911 RepID=UPI003460FD43